jgi:hypothetical protein
MGIKEVFIPPVERHVSVQFEAPSDGTRIEHPRLARKATKRLRRPRSRPSIAKAG